MKNLILAKRYVSAALLNLPKEKHQIIYDQLEMMRQVMTEHPDVDKIICSEIVKKARKIEFIASLLDGQENKDFWVQFFTVLILKNRSTLIKVCLSEFETLLCEALCLSHIRLTLAHTPDSETLEAIKKEVESILKCKAIFTIDLDKEIIGGFIAYTADKMIDASIRTSLQRFSRKRTKWY